MWGQVGLPLVLAPAPGRTVPSGATIPSSAGLGGISSLIPFQHFPGFLSHLKKEAGCW